MALCCLASATTIQLILFTSLICQVVHNSTDKLYTIIGQNIINNVCLFYPVMQSSHLSISCIVDYGWTKTIDLCTVDVRLNTMYFVAHRKSRPVNGRHVSPLSSHLDEH